MSTKPTCVLSGHPKRARAPDALMSCWNGHRGTAVGSPTKPGGRSTCTSRACSSGIGWSSWLRRRLKSSRVVNEAGCSPARSATSPFSRNIGSSRLPDRIPNPAGVPLTVNSRTVVAGALAPPPSTVIVTDCGPDKTGATWTVICTSCA